MEKLGPGDPREIGAYRLLARLGAGGMGQVYLARSGRGRTVAVKLVREEHARKEEFRARFRREVQAAQRVGGAWTAPVLDADTEAAVPWVATGYVAGPSLQQVVEHDHGALPERSVRILAAGLAHALKDIHTAGIVHRDLKPSNVLVTIDGPRVIDFGIARALETAHGDGLTSIGSLVGSPGFMAPEQVRGDRITPACDVFCLGSLLAYAASGALPFGGAKSGVPALMFRIAQEDPDLTGVPEGIADLVRECLRKDPAARPTLDRILAHTDAEDMVSDGRSRDPWLPASLVAQLGRHAVQLLDTEDPEGGTTAAGPAPGTDPAGPGRGPVRDDGGAAVPGGDAASPYGGVPVRNGDTAPVFGGAAVPGGDAASPYGGVPVRNGDTAPVFGGAAVPGGDAASPYGGVPVRNGDTAPVLGGMAVPHGDTASARGGATVPDGGAADPHGGATAPDGSATVPDGGGTARDRVPPAREPAAPAPDASPEHAPAAPPWPGSQGGPAGEPPLDHLPTMAAGRTPPPDASPAAPAPGAFGAPGGYADPGAPGAYGHAREHPQPAGHGHPQQPYPLYGDGSGPTPRYGPSPVAPDAYGPGPGPKKERRGSRASVLLVAIALVAALAAGGSVYAVLNQGAPDDDARGGTATTAPPDSGRATTGAPPSSGSADGAVPTAYLGTWTASIENAAGHNTRELTIEQGKVGDSVLTLVADGPSDGGGTYHCVFRAELTEQPGSEGPLRIGPSSVATAEPASSCTPGSATEISLLPDGRIRRMTQSSGETLTYSRG
ncbi:protein kinase [Streptomyces sp. NPDC001270]|uniref:serine/threonine-protein kinase n=1 Tax=Streptomyces sp. NPDC001270 TaxID=3364554 RepID=UPI003688D289